MPDAWWEQLRFDPSCRMLEGTFPAVLAPLRDVALAGNRRRTQDRTQPGRNECPAGGRSQAEEIGWPGERRGDDAGRAGEVLVICEGLETAIGITMGNLVPSGTPVWALSGASFLSGFQCCLV